MIRTLSMNQFDPYNSVIVIETYGHAGLVEHNHDFIEMILVTAGQGLHVIKGKATPVTRGDLFIVADDASHSIVPTGQASEFIWLNFLVGRDLFPDRERLCTNKVWKGVPPFLLRMADTMYQEYRDKTLYYQQRLQAYAQVFFYEFLRVMEQERADKLRADSVYNKRSAYIDRAIRFVVDRYADPVHLSDMAAYVGISPGYLEKLFREDRDSSPIEYLTTYRIQQACVLLINTGLSVAQVGRSVGIGDMKFFYEAFKKENGVSPGTYRRERGKILKDGTAADSV